MSLKPLKNKNMALNEWKQEAIFHQDRISDHCSKKRWDNFVYYQHDKSMFLKISGALFGPPQSEHDSGMSKEQNELVVYIISKIKQHSYHKKECNMAIIHIFVFTHDCQSGCIPVFRVAQTGQLSNGLTSPELSKFIDNCGRVYNSWNHFLNTNTIERAHICVPVNGHYSGNYDYQFINMSKKGLAVRGIDIASTVTAVGSCVGMVAGAVMTAFPPTAPIGAAVLTGSIAAGLPGGVWTAGRSIEGLVDRGVHEESINLDNSEARKHWLMCTTSILSLGTFGVAKGIALGAQAGKTIPSAVLNICTGLKVSTVGMTAIGVTDQIFQLAIKKEKVTAFDILALSTQILVLTHGIVTFSTAKAIVQEAQDQRISSFKRFLGFSDQKKFDFLLKGNVEKYSSPIMGKQEMIRTLQVIDLKTYLSQASPNSNNVSSEIFNITSSTGPVQSCSIFKTLIDKLKPAIVNSIVTPENIPYLCQVVQPMIMLFKNHPYFNELKEAIEIIKDILRVKNKNKVVEFIPIIQKCIEYFSKCITKMRVDHPNPPSNGKNVIEHYKKVLNDGLKTDKNRNEFATFFNDLIDKFEDNPFTLSSLDQNRCDDIIDEMEGRVVPDETKVWKHHDQDLAACTIKSEEYQNTITFFDCGNDSIYVYNEKSDIYKTYKFNDDKKINLLSFNKTIEY